jgi:hypothetical protein
MEIRSGKAYANTIMTYRGSAGGSNQGKTYTEGIDDTKDVNGSVHYSFFVTVDDKKYFGEFNFATGLRQIAHQLGLAKDSPVKTGTQQAGAFGNGLTADLAFKDPIVFYSESAWTGLLDGKEVTEFHTLKFRFKDFVAAYEAVPENIASVAVQEYLTVSDDRPSSMNKFLAKIALAIKSDQVRAEFQKIIANDTLKNSMFRLYELPATTHLSADYYRAFIPNLQMYYHKAAQQGFTIIHTQDDQPTDNTFIINKENAIDPLGDRKKFPVLCWKAIMRRHGDALITAVSWWNELEPAITETVYAYPSSDGRKTRVPDVSNKAPTFWATAAPYVTLMGEMNILNEAANKEQFDAVNRIKKGLNTVAPHGTDIQGVNDLRGIMLEWVYRLIGKPYWPKDRTKGGWGFGDSRNAMFPRCVVRIQGDHPDPKQQKKDCIEALKVQSNKHNNGMDECEKMIRIVFAMMYGTLVHSYSCTGAGKNKNGRMVPWNLQEFKMEMKNQWFPESALVPAQAPGAQAPATPVRLALPPPVTMLHRSSGLEPVAPVVKPVAKPVIPAKPIVIPEPETKVKFDDDSERKEVDIIVDGEIQHSISYLGTFHVMRNMLKDMLMAMGDEKFLKFVEGFEGLMDEFTQ